MPFALSLGKKLETRTPYQACSSLKKPKLVVVASRPSLIPLLPAAFEQAANPLQILSVSQPFPTINAFSLTPSLSAPFFNPPNKHSIKGRSTRSQLFFTHFCPQLDSLPVRYTFGIATLLQPPASLDGDLLPLLSSPCLRTRMLPMTRPQVFLWP